MADVHHETSDANLGGVLAFALWFVGTGIVILGFVGLFMWFLSGRAAQRAVPDNPLAVQQENRLPPEPRLQTDPRRDLATFRAQEDALLTSYGWVDRPAGIVRIPIEEAMKLTVQRGLPSRPQREGGR